MGAEDRTNPRYSRQLDVDVDGLEIVSTNVSTGGVQLSCPEMRYAGFQSAERDGAVALKIRVPGSRTWIRVNARVRYADLVDDEYLIGCQFIGLAGEEEQNWSKYISTLMNAKPIS